MMQQEFHSGENCPKTGKYSEYTKDGKLYNEDIDVEKGQRFPPTQQKGSYFKLGK
ncbi:MAG: YjzC family protein [Erysipelotrichia bacterium]|nr:YjzC family protein [Erysipelotrichia bacterium]